MLLDAYPARLSDRELMHLSDLAGHPKTPAPLRECLRSMGGPEVKRRLWVENEDFTPPEVQPATIDASGWTLSETVDSIGCVSLRLETMAKHGMTDGPLVQLLRRLLLCLLAAAKSKARAET